MMGQGGRRDADLNLAVAEGARVSAIPHHRDRLPVLAWLLGRTKLNAT